MELKIKKKLVICKSYYDSDYILFLHNETKRGCCWRRLFKGNRNDCINFKRKLNESKI